MAIPRERRRAQTKAAASGMAHEERRADPPARPLRRRLRTMLENIHSRSGRRFALFIQALILLSLLFMALETLPDLPAWAHDFFHVFEWFVLIVFTAEYLARLWATAHPLRYATSFHGLIDLAVIAPFWLLGADVRELRGLLLLRLLRVFKLVRYARSLDHFIRAWRMVREDVQTFAVIVALFIYLSALGIWHFEHQAQPEKYTTVFDALWWAVITLTTVGYGDVYPVTTGGRLLTMGLVLLGLGLVAVPSGLLASAFQEIRRRNRVRELRELKAELELLREELEQREAEESAGKK